MIISATVVNPRKPKKCEACNRDVYHNAIRFYGCCDRGDKPYVVWSHWYCVYDPNPKAQAAVAIAKGRSRALVEGGVL